MFYFLIFTNYSVLDLDNLTIPTTINALRTLLPSNVPAQLSPTPRKVKELPCYVPVAACGFVIYVLATKGGSMCVHLEPRASSSCLSFCPSLHHFESNAIFCFSTGGPGACPNSACCPFLLWDEMQAAHGLSYDAPTTYW